ncbi:MAG: helix-turn-helix domain-containing protein, partial [Defluviitaleaceae bacterium]|nr:helix-turn-helix domain-containing protein [Defluviitaleaceae bacterium]
MLIKREGLHSVFEARKAGEQIAVYRKKMKYTQEELAEKLGVSSQAVSKWENGNAMPEVALLAELSETLACSIDSLLTPMPCEICQGGFDYEFTALPKAPVSEYLGPEWPKSIAEAAILAALKLFMGLEIRRDFMNKQINDDEEYIMQAAFSNICFGYSWARQEHVRDCFLVYGLGFDVYKKADYTEEQFALLARKQIENGYPVIIYPGVYTDVIFATGYSNNGKVLKGLVFLDGDDAKNAKIDFTALRNYDGWYAAASEMLLVKPSKEKISLERACVNALRRAIMLLTNTEQVRRPSDVTATVYGYGTVVYDSWMKMLEGENKRRVDNLTSLFPHVFIHYEGKLRTKQFFERCVHIISGIDQPLLASAIKQYNEMIGFANEMNNICMKQNEFSASDINEKR